jgi:phytoene dehydrogenase-like protein
MTVVEQYAPGISSLVVAAQVITPAELERDYGLAGGHIFHGELALDQLFTMRPVIGHGSYDSPIHGLFLCGAGTHPGGFMTGASGRLAAREVIARSKGKGQRAKVRS